MFGVNSVIFVFSISAFMVCLWCAENAVIFLYSFVVLIPDSVDFKNTTSITNTTKLLSGPLERTLIIIKPDAVQRGLIGKIIERFEAKGFHLVAMKMLWASKQRIEQHYEDIQGRDFYSRLVRLMTSGPVIPMVWEGLDAVKMGRKLIGSTNAESMPSTIRGGFSIDIERSIVHGSSLPEEAAREIRIWFDEDELVEWTAADAYFINEFVH